MKKTDLGSVSEGQECKKGSVVSEPAPAGPRIDPNTQHYGAWQRVRQRRAGLAMDWLTLSQVFQKGREQPKRAYE